MAYPHPKVTSDDLAAQIERIKAANANRPPVEDLRSCPTCDDTGWIEGDPIFAGGRSYSAVVRCTNCYTGRDRATPCSEGVILPSGLNIEPDTIFRTPAVIPADPQVTPPDTASLTGPVTAGVEHRTRTTAAPEQREASRDSLLLAVLQTIEASGPLTSGEIARQVRRRKADTLQMIGEACDRGLLHPRKAGRQTLFGLTNAGREILT